MQASYDQKKKIFSYLLAVGRRPRDLIVMVLSMGNVGGPIESVYVRMVHASALCYKSVNFLF